jgi:hypothetical protein
LGLPGSPTGEGLQRYLFQRFIITNVSTRMEALSEKFGKIAILVLLTTASSFAQVKGWRQILDERLTFFGDQNWIVIADSGFPLLSAPGIETIVSNEPQVNTVRHVLDLLSKDEHVKPIVHNALELEHVAEQDAPGISAYRQLISGLFEKFLPEPPPKPTAHANLIHYVGEAAKTYNVLVIKTNMVLPYTAVFVELRTGYWSDEAEKRLRESIH